MAKTPDPLLLEILAKYDEQPAKAMWDCHGTWVVYHKAIERIAAKAGITFDMPEIIEAKSADKIVAIVVRGFMGDRAEWSFGEAAPNNNKNAYPYAMAEKRAKDRVVLKLVGLHGLVYSEEESDDFKSSAPAPVKSSAALKREGEWDALVSELHNDLQDCRSLAGLSRLRADYRERAKASGWPKAWLESLKNEFDQHEDAILNDGEQHPVPKDAFVDNFVNGRA